MKKDIRIGIFQYDILWENIQGNHEIIEKHIQSINSLPNLLVLPEMYTTGFTINPATIDKKQLEEQFKWQVELSMNYQIHIMGSIIHYSEGRYFNRFFHTTPKGETNTYDKKHLFQIGGEDKHYSAGNNRKVIDLEGIKIMPQICYDLRFPVWSRNNIDYHILVYSSNWPLNRRLAWDTLLRARAIENQCFVIGTNRIGTDKNGYEYFGGSSVYGPQGELLLILDSDETYQEVTVSIEALEKYKESFPVYKDADLFEIKNRE